MTEVGQGQLHASMFHIICMIFEKAVLHVEPWDDSCTTSENMHESHHREENSLSTRHGIQHTDACKELSQPCHDIVSDEQPKCEAKAA